MIFIAAYILHVINALCNIEREVKHQIIIIIMYYIYVYVKLMCILGPHHAKTCLRSYTNSKCPDQPAHL